MKVRVITAALALAALTAIPAAAASAATAHVGHPMWSYIWKPGTPLPRVGPGQKLSAWPVQSVMGKIRDGQAVPMVAIGHTTAAGKFIQTASSATVRRVTSYGRVNLLAEPDACPAPAFKNLGKKLTSVGTTFSLIRPVTASFQYSQGQSSSLEVGLSYSGKNGSFSGDGDISVSKEKSEGFAPDTGRGDDRYETEFRYGKYHFDCETRFGQVDYYLVQAYEWAAGATTAHPKRTPAFKKYNCVYQEGDSTFSEDSSTAITFSAGFSIVGFTGSAQTGYDNSAQMDLHFIHQGDVCGTNDVPGGTPRVVGAASTRGT